MTNALYDIARSFGVREFLRLGAPLSAKLVSLDDRCVMTLWHAVRPCGRLFSAGGGRTLCAPIVTFFDFHGPPSVSAVCTLVFVILLFLSFVSLFAFWHILLAGFARFVVMCADALASVVVAGRARSLFLRAKRRSAIIP